MRVYFDVGHPAHVHLFKNAIRTLRDEGHEVAVTSREKEVTTDLLDAYDIDHTVLSVQGEATWELLAEWTLREFRTVRFARRFDPDVVVSRIVPPAVHAAKLVGAASVVFADTEDVRNVARVTAPLVDYWCTPESFQDDYGRRHRRHAGVQELAYLHPDWFEVDRDSLREHGVDPDAPYAVLRFVSMRAHHDVGRNETSAETKRALVERLSEYGDVYVSAEGELPPELAEFESPVPPEAMHDLLAAADLMVTDSWTMATEASLLATPTIRSIPSEDDRLMGVFEELACYDLVELIADDDEVLRRAVELAESPDAEAEWTERRDRYLAATTDVTAYMLDVIEEAADSD